MILVVRLGAMGDIIHTLPAVASLKAAAPITWIIEPKWAYLLEGNPHVDRIAFLDRSSPATLLNSWRDLRAQSYDLAIDFQGLLKSAFTASAALPARILGFDQRLIRERAAAVFYADRVLTTAAHVVDRNLDLAVAAGAPMRICTFPLPPGHPEGDLPSGDFVLASPLAGWRSKQWPLDYYRALAARLRSEFHMPLVLNAAPGTELPAIDGAAHHFSGIPGLIHATRRAAAIIGVDSGPMHIAAALAKPGVAIFGPTDPARNGPYGDSLRVLRSPTAATSYKRGATIDESMRNVSPDQVFDALRSACCLTR